MSKKKVVEIIQVTIRFKEPGPAGEFMRANIGVLAHMITEGVVEIIVCEGKKNE